MLVDESILTVAECAQFLRVDVTTVRRWIEQGTLAAIQLPNRGNKQRTRRMYRIHRSTIEQMVNPVAVKSK